jgi:CO/xanthine dehydrogenase Mo-binding subunit
MKRPEGPAKLRGEAIYIDDLHFPEMIYGATVRSPVSRGVLKKIHFPDNIDGINWNEFTVVTAQDIPGVNYVTMIKNDWPFLAHTKINHPGEALVLLAHPDRAKLEDALNKVQLEIEKLPPVTSIPESLEKNQIIWGEDNLFKSILIEKGRGEDVWALAHKIVTGTYISGAQEHLYIENQGVIAQYLEEEGLIVWGSLQCPYYVHGALGPLLKLPAEKVRVIQMETGGGFGGKEDYPSLLAGHAALLAWKSKKPVKMMYHRSEDMLVTTKRHPSRTIHKTAVDQNGKLLAMEIDFVLDGGAYATLSEVVLSRGAIHAAGPYSCEHVRIRARAVATNSPPNGAFRGFGAPQSLFALEKHMDHIARTLRLSPVEVRRVNFIKQGQTTATGQVIKEKVDFNRLLDLALNKLDYQKKLVLFHRQNARNRFKKGLGFACFMHGAGFTGSGEKYLASKVGLAPLPDGKVKILCASTEIGQGRNAVLAQAVAEVLKIPVSEILTPLPDTREAPNSGPTVASRTTMIIGKLLQTAAEKLMAQLQEKKLLQQKFTSQQMKKAIQKYASKSADNNIMVQYQHPEDIIWDDKTYQGDAYPTFAWAVYAAETTTDTLTYQSKVDNFVAVQEIGRVMNRILAEGQIEGGVAQAIGYTLYEKVIAKEGRMLNNRMANYIIPSAMDLPLTQVVFLEWNKKYGPRGAKGIGELPMDGTAPAILNALGNAFDREFHTIPLLPEDLMNTVENNNAGR